MVVKQQHLFRKLGKPSKIYKTRPSNDNVPGLALGSAELPDEDLPDGYLIDEGKVIFDTDNKKALLDAERPPFLPSLNPFKEYPGNLVVKINESGAEYRIETIADEATIKPAVWECTISKRSTRSVING